jgi:hypothetical protein
MTDEWNKPTAPVKSVTTPGVTNKGPISPRVELEPVEPMDMDPAELETIEQLRSQNKELQHEVRHLQGQMEEAWAIIKSRDEQLEATRR